MLLDDPGQHLLELRVVAVALDRFDECSPLTPGGFAGPNPYAEGMADDRDQAAEQLLVDLAPPPRLTEAEVRAWELTSARSYRAS